MKSETVLCGKHPATADLKLAISRLMAWNEGDEERMALNYTPETLTFQQDLYAVLYAAKAGQ